MNPPPAKAETISNAARASVITYLRKGKDFLFIYFIPGKKGNAQMSFTSRRAFIDLFIVIVLSHGMMI